MPLDKASDEQLQIPASENIRRDKSRALLHRKMGDPNHHLSYTGRTAVGGTLGQGQIWKPMRSPCQIKPDQKANSHLHHMYFFNLSTCIYTFWLCSSLTVIRLIGKDPGCFSHRLGLTTHYLKMCCGCVSQICWTLAKKQNVIALLTKQCIVIHSMHEFSAHSIIYLHRWAYKLIIIRGFADAQLEQIMNVNSYFLASTIIFLINQATKWPSYAPVVTSNSGTSCDYHINIWSN